MSELTSSLIVEVHLDGVRVTGLLRQPAENRRLVDILNSQEDTLVLDTVEAHLLADGIQHRYKSALVRKSEVLFAIPRETADQVRRRAVMRSGLATAAQRLPLELFLPQCHITGTATLTTAMTRTQLEPSMFARFFPLIDAVITRPGHSPAEEQVVIVHRDALMLLGRIEA